MVLRGREGTFICEVNTLMNFDTQCEIPHVPVACDVSPKEPTMHSRRAGGTCVGF